MPKEPEWTRFSVGELNQNPNWENTSCQRLNNISHIAHIGDAIQIVSDNILKSGLVYDKSKLNNSRISVNWLSPNDWAGAGGFRYGNVRFKFDWQPLVNRKKYYWVESVAYGIEACRILISEKDYSGLLEPYDPRIKNGPWWYDEANDQHYWNGNYCLEIMVERNINIHEITSIDFVDHHPQYCSIDPMTCKSRGLSRRPASARFISFIIGHNIPHNRLLFTQREDENIIPTSELSKAWTQFILEIKSLTLNYYGVIGSAHDCAIPIANAIYNSFAHQNYNEIGKLSTSFRSKNELLQSCTKAFALYFGITDWRSLMYTF